uniref:Uncharacterized protein n=1 Tax=Cyanothece sp. (strain PCC 7425 / ATCC 29141) TaxID=395961 RepID=B8HZI8_CYAP4
MNKKVVAGLLFFSALVLPTLTPLQASAGSRDDYYIVFCRTFSNKPYYKVGTFGNHFEAKIAEQRHEWDGKSCYIKRYA